MRYSLFILFLVIGLHIFFLFNLQFTAWPEMFSYAYLKNNGFLLYKDMIHPYPPLLTLGLSWLYKIFGYKVEVLKILAWTIIIFNDLVIFQIVKKLTKNSNVSLIAVFVYILLQPFLEGNMLWFDLAIVPSILIGIYYFISERTAKNLFISGLSFGIATFTKQTAGLFLVITLIILLLEKIKLKNLLVFLTGPLIIILTFGLRLFLEDSLTAFINSTLLNPFLYWSDFPGYVQLNLQRHDFLILTILLIPVFLTINKSYLKKDRNIIYLLLFLVLSAVMVYPRFSYFHLQLFIALASIFFGYQIIKFRNQKVFIFASTILISVFIVSPSIKTNWKKEVRFYSKEDIEQANTIKKNTSTSEKVFFLGLNSNIYTMANKLPPKPWTDNFGWYLEVPGVQEDIVIQWDKNPPTKIFWQEPGKGNWFDLGVYQPKIIVEWINNNYTRSTKLSNNIWMWEIKR